MRKLRPLHSECIRKALADASDSSAEQRYLHRLHCVLLVSVGHSCYVVASWFGEDPRTIERWVQAFERSGPSALRDHHGGGRPTRLSAEQTIVLGRELGRSPRDCGYETGEWSGRLLKDHLETRYAIRLSPRQCQRILRATRTPGATGGRDAMR